MGGETVEEAFYLVRQLMTGVETMVSGHGSFLFSRYVIWNASF